MVNHPRSPTIDGIREVEMTVTVATRADFRAIRKTAERELAAEHPGIKEWFKKHKDDYVSGFMPVFVIKDEGEIIAFIVGREDKRLDVKCSILFVIDDYWRDREEMASRLLAALEKTFSGKKKWIHHNVLAKDRAELEFFRKHGYWIVKDAGWHHPTENPDELWYTMKKALPPLYTETFKIHEDYNLMGIRRT